MIQEKAGFALGDIRINQFASFEENRNPEKSIEYLIHTDIDLVVSVNEKGVGLILGFTFEQDEKVCIKIETMTDFHIDNTTWESFYKENEIIIPRELVKRFSDICIGATRGILVEKTRNTAFSDFLLPLMDVDSLIVQDAHFSLDEEE